MTVSIWRCPTHGRSAYEVCRPCVYSWLRDLADAPTLRWLDGPPLEEAPVIAPVVRLPEPQVEPLHQDLLERAELPSTSTEELLDVLIALGGEEE